MSFESRFGITKITKRLTIAIDTHAMVNEIPAEESMFAVFTHTPYLDDLDDHYHIEMGREEVQELYDWLDSFLRNNQLSKKYVDDLNRKRKI